MILDWTTYTLLSSFLYYLKNKKDKENKKHKENKEIKENLEKLISIVTNLMDITKTDEEFFATFPELEKIYQIEKGQNSEEYSEAFFLMNICTLLGGMGYERQIEKSIEELQRAALKSHIPSLSVLARLYEHGDHIAKDEGLAFKYQLQAAEADYPQAQEIMGYLLLNQAQKSSTRDELYARAKYYFERAAKTEYPEGIMSLATFLSEYKKHEKDQNQEQNQNQNQDQNQDQTLIQQLHYKAALGGCLFSLEQVALKSDVIIKDKSDFLKFGKILLKSSNNKLEQEQTLGLQFCLAAVRLGDEGGLNFLGECLETGKYFEKNEVRAFYFYDEAKRKGSFHATLNLARSYRDGLGVTKDSKQAIEILTQLSKENLESLNYVAYCFQTGHCVPKDEKIAFQMFSEAASHGFADAQQRLARAYQLGLGTPKDEKLAIEWKTKYAENIKSGKIMQSAQQANHQSTQQSTQHSIQQSKPGKSVSARSESKECIERIPLLVELNPSPTLPGWKPGLRVPLLVKSDSLPAKHPSGFTKAIEHVKKLMMERYSNTTSNASSNISNNASGDYTRITTPDATHDTAHNAAHDIAPNAPSGTARDITHNTTLVKRRSGSNLQYHYHRLNSSQDNPVYGTFAFTNYSHTHQSPTNNYSTNDLNDSSTNASSTNASPKSISSKPNGINGKNKL